MKALFLLIVINVLFISKSPSQTKHDNIKELIVVMKVDSLARSALRQAIILQINRRNFAKKDSNAIIEFGNSFKTEEQKTADKLIYTDILEFYDSNFTNDELKDLIVFYKSSAGQKALKLFPNIEVDIWKMLKEKYVPAIIEKVDSLENQVKRK